MSILNQANHLAIINKTSYMNVTINLNPNQEIEDKLIKFSKTDKRIILFNTNKFLSGFQIKELQLNHLNNKQDNNRK